MQTVTTGQPTVSGWGYGVHGLSVLVCRIRDAEAGGGPFAFYVLGGKQLLICKECESLLCGWGEDHVVLVPGSDTFLCGLIGSKKQFMELSPWSLDAWPSELAWHLAASAHAQLRNFWFTVFKHWHMCLFLIGLSDSWAVLELTLLHTLFSRCIMCLLPLLTVFFSEQMF